MQSDVLRLPEDQQLSGSCFVLRSSIPALQLVEMDNNHARWGPMTQLPRGAELQECGKGFDDKTLRVRCSNSFYVVFLQDLSND